ncbi:UNVERIFIED_CONTAM: hypothetical protein Sindi_0336400 [Sesamum indicum]
MFGDLHSSLILHSYKLLPSSIKVFFIFRMRSFQRVTLALIILQQIVDELTVALTLFTSVTKHLNARKPHRPRTGPPRFLTNFRVPEQLTHLHRLVSVSDELCLRNLRMDRNAFGRLCYLLQHAGGVSESRAYTVPEQVAIFLSVVAHHKKICVVKHDFLRSGRTIHKHFHRVLRAVIKLYNILLGCLGALDGTFIDVRVPEAEKGRYRTRKGHVAVNVLGVCNPNMQFIYVLSGWEGSAADNRVLRDAVHRQGGLRIPTGSNSPLYNIPIAHENTTFSGQYYLCDNGYANAEGFLTPYRGVRYHLREWDSGAGGPQDKFEFFNLKHSSARNVIERTFGLLKMRWGILRSPSFYPIKVQNRIILACCLLHNFLRTEMPDDPLVNELPSDGAEGADADADCVWNIKSNPSWNSWRDAMATTMYNEWTSCS